MIMRPEAVILYCTWPPCQQGYGSVGEIPARCPACGRSVVWTTTPPHGDTPRIAYALTANDKAFLHRRGIMDDEPV
jgi:hypothetical protein